MMDSFKKEVITYFQKQQRKSYLKLQQDQAFSEELQMSISQGIMQVVYNLTNKLNDYNPKIYGSLEEWETLIKTFK